ncbi:class I adenylate-forming enzyme family protein [Acidiplasma cupricumulans]|uniref:Acyl-CoA synthetase n=1 Tax=Acidiplasma cupricumulans TaxID=312540 RepID=A0A0Q0WKX8_9ARCH|nr:class I adenylate-forming enzyme family protein [Acidiplasma cupricumulans]KQB36400.1 hypothetical protein AOG55_04220 [Acidiplasma cupricumulans]
MKTMLDFIKYYDNDIFIKYFDSSITYGDFYKYVNGIAAQLASYGDDGSIIAMISENIPQFIMVQHACWKNGMIFTPLSPLDSYEELSRKVKFLNPAVVIISSEFRDSFGALNGIVDGKIIYTDPETFGKIPEGLKNKFIKSQGIEELNLRKKPYFDIYRPDPEDTAMLVFTSGTSGKQKAAEIRHKNIYSASFIYKNWFDVGKKDVNLGIAPFFHITGLIFGISLSVISHSKIVLNYRFTPEQTLNDIIKNKTTITMFVATAYRSMLNSWSGIDDIKNKLSSMRVWSAGGMPMPVKTEIEWKKMTGKYIYMAYGLTESTSPLTLWDYPYNGELKIYKDIVSSGRPVYYTTIKRSRGGELIARGPQVVSGYYHNAEDTKLTFSRNGMKTGDICHIDSNNWVYIIDRKKDLIDISGYKVWPVEIENAIRSSQFVEDVVVVPEKDEYKGEVPVAYVKLKDNINPYDEIKNEINNICREKLAKFKIPKNIVFINRMPVNASGKIKRSDIHKILGDAQ